MSETTEPPPLETAVANPCPVCGAPLRRWYANFDGDDVEPRAECSNLSCDYGY